MATQTKTSHLCHGAFFCLRAGKSVLTLWRVEFRWGQKARKPSTMVRSIAMAPISTKGVDFRRPPTVEPRKGGPKSKHCPARGRFPREAELRRHLGRAAPHALRFQLGRADCGLALWPCCFWPDKNQNVCFSGIIFGQLVFHFFWLAPKMVQSKDACAFPTLPTESNKRLLFLFRQVHRHVPEGSFCRMTWCLGWVWE